MRSTVPLNVPAKEALTRLKEGNSRYLAGESRILQIVGAKQRRETLPQQHPFAAVVSCSDSRVPVEVLFDHGLGELFVIRVAGNLVGVLEAASVEYAVEYLGVKLVVIMGHTGCGAVHASLMEMQRAAGDHSDLQPCIHELVQRLSRSLGERLAGYGETGKPSYESGGDPSEGLLQEAIRTNIQISIDDLREQSEFLSGLDTAGSIAIVGAEYDIGTGIVEFLSDRAR